MVVYDGHFPSLTESQFHHWDKLEKTINHNIVSFNNPHLCLDEQDHTNSGSAIEYVIILYC